VAGFQDFSNYVVIGSLVNKQVFAVLSRAQKSRPKLGELTIPDHHNDQDIDGLALFRFDLGIGLRI
jgi:hypothetical protein